ncbi:penicillin-binding protein 2 [Flavobacteria bacterium BAL38]|uniref:peptidoglycan D,D-transpeptidase FtsI family protein n=1 Tax=unclassified Flavobacterium TaxID=196869 RepID=UPI0000F39A19|nr:MULTISPECIES: penicillin-binding transpeptidase domain-containing protein [unclassified Flavobacterium]EAZ96511.1 penicillin-binding protein 2 [Flavobacteria bacterium BAL38]MQP52635.1 penicillin-binding protein 2 [Flavobacterium sp. LMO9]MQP62185.1 penicillin-binding protein 2 [Flavobacterium sp. LMO6]
MRKAILPAVIIITSIILITRIFYLQVIDETLKLKSENNAIKKVFDFPERGYIYDRNGKLLVANQPSYDIMVVPREIKNIDTTEFCSLLRITKDYFIKKIEKAKVYSPMLPSVFLAQLNKAEYAAFQEKERKFEGFYTQKRALRDYQVKEGANIFGFITQVNEAILNKNKYYNSGDLIGKQGVEQQYEDILRGIKGVKYLLRDKHNKIIGPYKNGQFDTIAQQGKDLTLTIDHELQKYGTELMINKRGGIVAIEPKTGEILALVSAPTFDPAMLVGRQRSKNYTELYNDSIAKPLYDRGLQATYPPGSPFKIITGLIGLQEEVIDEQTTFYCNHGANFGRFMKCHCGLHTLQLNNGVYKSCNSYFGNTYKRTIEKYNDSYYSVDNWANHVRSFGLGQFLGTDMPIGSKGLVPDSKMYKKMYNGAKIRSSYIISNSIGQGEVSTSTIQLANMMAVVANKGYYYTPHIVKKIKGQVLDKKFTTKHYSTIDEQYFDPMIQGLSDVYKVGTAWNLKVEGLEICGKTGTAENKIRVGGKTYQLKDHSIFVAFAPKENPTIAIAVVVENGYWGNRWAGPIATLMAEKYVTGKITRKDLETTMLNGSLLEEYKRIENIIFQRKVDPTRVQDSLNKVNVEISDAKKEEEEN